MGTLSNSFLVITKDEMSKTILFCTPWFVEPWILSISKNIPYIGCSIKVYTTLLRIWPHTAKILLQNSYFTVSPKAIPFIYKDRGFNMVGYMLRTSVLQILSLLILFSGCDMSSLVRSNVVWNIITVNIAFWMFMNDNLGRRIMCRKGKCITRVNIYLSMGKELQFSWRK